jgi:hypothetical protein
LAEYAFGEYSFEDSHQRPRTRGNIVFDLLMLASLAVAFGGAVAYVWACVDLTRGTSLDKTP